jgi:hypothetical protein
MRGLLERLDAGEVLAERLEEPTVLLSDHVTNFLDINDRIPDDTDVMLEAIDEALEWPLTRFRPPTERSINVGL